MASMDHKGRLAWEEHQARRDEARFRMEIHQMLFKKQIEWLMSPEYAALRKLEADG